MAYKPVGNPLPLDIFDPQVGPDHRVDLGAYQRLQYSPQDPATSAGLGLPQQYTTSQPYDGDPAVMRQAYADQEARLGPMRLPSETSDEVLGPNSSMQAQPVSSGPSDFNWLTAIGAGLQSAGAAHFGNYGVGQGYMQMKQQADQRKQAFAQQQAQLAEQKRQHSMGIMWDLIKSQNMEGIKAFGDQDKTEVGALARNIGMAMNQADLAELPEYLNRGWITPEELKDAHNWTPSRTKAKVATLRKRTDVVNKAMEEKALLHEAYRKQRAGEQLDAYEQQVIDDHATEMSLKKADTRLKTAQAVKTETGDDGRDHFTNTAYDTSQGLFLKSPNQIKPDELVDQADVARAKVWGVDLPLGQPRLAALGMVKSLTIPTKVAGAKAAASTEATQNTALVPPERLSNLINVPDFIRGKTRYPGHQLTQAQAADPSQWKELTDKQKEAVRTMEQAQASQQLVFDLAESLGQKEGAGAALVHGMKNKFGAFFKSNPVAAAFIGDRKAFATYFRNMEESGVMTEADREAWGNLLPDERETVASFKVKKVIMNEIMNIANTALRAQIVGDVEGLSQSKQNLSQALKEATMFTKAGKGDKKALNDMYDKMYGGTK